MAVLFQMKLDQSIVDCGMSYVFQLTSGHFFVIDGGFFTPGEADRLYRFLRDRCEGKPVIDGWFFSHAHQDHVGVFLDMMEEHRDDVIIRKLIYNYQPLELPQTSEGWNVVKNDPATVKRFYEVVEQYFSPDDVYTPRTGDRWQQDELEIEVLYTHEDLDVSSTFNDRSAVLRIVTAGWSMMFLGDVYQQGSRLLLANCPEKLKSDIVQVAHHGFAGATPELYQAIGARVALWPTTREELSGNLHREANDYLLNHSGVTQHLIAGDGTLEITFPPRAETDETSALPLPAAFIAHW